MVPRIFENLTSSKSENIWNGGFAIFEKVQIYKYKISGYPRSFSLHMRIKMNMLKYSTELFTAYCLKLILLELNSAVIQSSTKIFHKYIQNYTKRLNYYKNCDN